MSIEETTSNSLFPTMVTSAAWDLPRPSGLPNWDIDTRDFDTIMLPKETLPRPACYIRSSDCSEQWRLFKDHFSNWTTTLDHIDALAADKDMPCSSGGDGCAVFNDKLNVTRIDFELFLAWRGINAYNLPLDDQNQKFLDHPFLDGCSPILCDQCWGESGASYVDALMSPQPKEIFSVEDAQGVNTLSPAPIIGEKDRRCNVEADQFVLIYLPAAVKGARDVCANEGWGDTVLALAPNRMVTRTAILDQIVFQSRSDCKLLRSHFKDQANHR